METTTQKPSYWQKTFNKKLLIQKAIIAVIALAIVLTFSLSFYFWLHNKTGDIGTNPFWYISITWNPGFGFSGLSGQTGLIYFIQSLMFILLLSIYIFLTRDKVTCSFVALAMFGGFFNLIQRAAETGTNAGCVLDYFAFGFWKSFAIFNWPDMFVVIGIFGFVISYIVVTILEAKREDRAEKIAQYKKEQEKHDGQQH